MEAVNDTDRLVLSVTGNGRSGTSLISNFLDRAGIPMGIEMKPGGKGCRFGFYEDIDFLEFQKSVLKRNGSGLYTPWKPITISEEERKVARKLIELRDQKWVRWGWKDPRSTLFLPFWAEILPHARFLIMFRNPEEVLTSVYRQMHRHLRYLRPDLVPRAWIHYNRLALDFARSNPWRVAFLDVGDLKRDPHAVINALSRFLGVKLNPAVLEEVYRPKEMSAHDVRMYREPFISLCLRVSDRIWGETMGALYQELRRFSIAEEGRKSQSKGV